jgi:hypothetical protein
MNDEQDKTHGVWCEVSGGVTGTRQAWLKVGGAVWRGTIDEAQLKARECRHRAMTQYSRDAVFTYAARRLP